MLNQQYNLSVRLIDHARKLAKKQRRDSPDLSVSESLTQQANADGFHKWQDFLRDINQIPFAIPYGRTFGDGEHTISVLPINQIVLSVIPVYKSFKAVTTIRLPVIELTAADSDSPFPEFPFCYFPSEKRFGYYCDGEYECFGFFTGNLGDIANDTKTYIDNQFDPVNFTAQIYETNFRLAKYLDFEHQE